MKNIIGSLFLFFAFVNTSIAITDNREYVDWKDYPNIVKITSSGLGKNSANCTGTEIGKYVITAAHCVEGFHFFSIKKNDGTQVVATLENKGSAGNSQSDWAILRLLTDTKSTYKLFDEFQESMGSSDGIAYGFGDLRILTDEELTLVRQYLNDKNVNILSVDEVAKLLDSDIPGVGKIFNDGDNLKASPCFYLEQTNKGIEAGCFLSHGNSGGGLFINNTTLVGIASKGAGMYLQHGSFFTPVQKVVLELNYKLSDEKKDIPDFLSNKMACDGKTILADAILNNISQSLNHVTDLNTVEQIFGKYYYCYDAGMIMNDCGDLILKNFEANNIDNIEYKNGKYIITSKESAPIQMIYCKAKATDEWVKLLDQKIVNSSFTYTYISEDNNPDFNDALVSVDDGKTFYNGSDWLKSGIMESFFTREEIAEMPQELKQCLGIKKQ